MPEFLLLMHGDAAAPEAAWGPYLGALGAAGVLRGGSAIGEGTCLRKGEPLPGVTRHLSGYIKIEARDLEHAKELVEGNPIYEAGGTVEIRHLPRTS